MRANPGALRRNRGKIGLVASLPLLLLLWEWFFRQGDLNAASLGTLLFAATSFWLGHALGRDMLVRLGGRTYAGRWQQ